MCGIAGIYGPEEDHFSRQDAVHRMCHAMFHRGPDDGGLKDLGDLTLGMRRLSIIDLSKAGNQPLCNEDGTVWLVANGEIYNYKQIQRELIGRGHQFRSQTDVEVILHLYEEQGINFLSSLRGMFAFVLWDGRTKELWLVRDRFGIKPLYYASTSTGQLVFASETRAILASGRVPRDLNCQTLDLYLAFGYLPSTETLIQSVYALPAAHYAHIKKDYFEICRYWDFPKPGTTDWKASEVLSNTKSLLSESIQLHQVSDVPLGVFLSGGIDSSAISALMSFGGSTVKSFTLGFEDGPVHLNELELARDWSFRVGTEHIESVVTGVQVRDELGKIVDALDQPSFDGLNTYLVSKLAKVNGSKVALSGLGGDELFGGYGTFQILPFWNHINYLLKKIPDRARVVIAKLIATLFSQTIRGNKLRRIGSVQGITEFYAAIRLALWSYERIDIYSRSFRESTSNLSFDRPLHILGKCSQESNPWSLLQRLELQNYAGWRLLRDTDTMSMAWSLEVRVPLLDHILVENLLGLETSIWEKWGYPKQLLVESLREILPSSVFSRPKQGFQFPMNIWMAKELRPVVQDILSTESINRRGLFSPTGVQKLYKDFLKGRYSYEIIWQIIVLELWIRRNLDQDFSPPVS